MRHLRVADVMTRAVVTVDAGAPVREVVRRLADHRIGGAPVVDGGGRVIGMITEADLLARQVCGGGAVPVRRGPNRPGAAAIVAADVMSAPAVTIGPGARLHAAAALLAREGVKLVPVLDGAGVLCGIIGRRDLLSAYLRPDAELADEIRDGVLSGVLGLAPGEVSVEVHRGVVTVSGRVEHEAVADVVAALCESVDGVVAVRNEITAEAGAVAAPAPLSGAAISRGSGAPR